MENETFTKEDDAPSPSSKPKEEKQPLKVMPAPPPKENAWVKRSSNPPARSQSSDSEQHSPTRLVPCRGLWGGRPGPLPSGFAPCQEGMGDQILSPQAVNSSPCSMPLGSSSQGLDRVHHHLFFFIIFLFFLHSSSQTAPGLPLEDGAPPKNAHRKGETGISPSANRSRLEEPPLRDSNLCQRSSQNHPPRGEGARSPAEGVVPTPSSSHRVAGGCLRDLTAFFFPPQEMRTNLMGDGRAVPRSEVGAPAVALEIQIGG